MADASLSIIRSLAPEAAIRAWWLVAITRVAGYPVILTSGRRTRAEQERLVREGKSLTLNSAHLTGDAFDVDWLGWNRDDIPKQFWNELGPWAERELGLVWGGRWVSIRDYGHFEVPPRLRSRVA